MKEIITEWQKFIKESKARGRYTTRSIQTGEEKRYDGTHWYDEAIRVLQKAEDDFPVLIGALTKTNPETRDACLQEIAAKLESSYYGNLEPYDLFKTIEKALFNTFKPEESDNGEQLGESKVKFNKTFLQRVIREELKKVLKEGTNLPMSYLEVGTDYDPETGAEITKFDDMAIKGRRRDKNVVELQKLLVNKGFLDKKDIDGIIGPITTKAFNEFLASMGKTNPINVGSLKQLVRKAGPLITTALSAVDGGDSPADRQRAMAAIAGLGRSI